jgi:hypothetical protein
MAQTVGVVAAAMLGLWGFGLWQERSLAYGVATLRAQETALIQQLSQLGMTAGGANPRQALETRRLALAQERDAKRRLLEELAGPAEAPQGLAGYFAGIARQPVPGLWLTAVAVRKGGAEIELQGRAGRPEHVPRLVQRLGAEPVFQGKAFRRLRIYLPEDNEEDPYAGYAAFVLGTELEPAPDAEVPLAATGDDR